MTIEPRDTTHGKIALRFAQALVNGNDATAKTLLTSDLQSDFSHEVKTAYAAMIASWEGAPVDFIDTLEVLDNWPDREPNDIGWAYVAIGGGNYNEAIAVIVAAYEGELLIRSIEWGRP